MIERITDYPGYLIRFRPEKFSRVFFLLHGLPANRNTKNLDMAEYLSQKENACVYILHYRGLGESRGAFLFTQSIQEATAVARKIAAMHPDFPLSLIGHSWGGMIATNILHHAPQLLKQVILISPFCSTQKDGPLYTWLLEGIRDECPGIYGDLSQKEIEGDLKEFWDHHLPLNLAPSLDVEVDLGVIQALRDDTTPPANTKAFCAKLKKTPRYFELDTDHSFTEKRIELFKTLSIFLSEKKGV